LAGGAKSPKTGKIDARFFIDIDSVQTTGSLKNVAFLFVPLEKKGWLNSTIEYTTFTAIVDCNSSSFAVGSAITHLADGRDIPQHGFRRHDSNPPGSIFYLLNGVVCHQSIPSPSLPIYLSRENALAVAQQLFSRDQ
jgi:hypothetical protein